MAIFINVGELSVGGHQGEPDRGGDQGEEGIEARQPRPCKLLRQAIISYINITALELFLYNYLYQCYIHYITIGRTFNMLYEYCYYLFHLDTV